MSELGRTQIIKINQACVKSDEAKDIYTGRIVRFVRAFCVKIEHPPKVMREMENGKRPY
jgi:hypothetical protein